MKEALFYWFPLLECGLNYCFLPKFGEVLWDFHSQGDLCCQKRRNNKNNNVYIFKRDMRTG